MDLASVCATCRPLHNVGVSLLYHTIDLSSHNAQFDCKSEYSSDFRVPPNFVRRKWTHYDYLVYQRQDSLLRTFKNGCSFGKHVRELHWTVIDLDWIEDFEWEDKELARKFKELQDPGGIAERARDESMDNGTYWSLQLAVYKSRAKAVSNLFQSFVNATYVDICWIDECRNPIPPIPLFPRAKSIRLGGLTTLEEVENILNPSCKRVEHLELNNLLQWSEVDPPVPKFTSSEQLEAYLKVHNTEHKPIEHTRLMAGPLDQFLGQCTALTSLSICAAGNGGDWLSGVDWDDRRYSSWARFIDSVRGQLHYLSFKQGICKVYNEHLCPNQWRRGWDPDLVIAIRFEKWILPVLLDSPWPFIKRMEIKGTDMARNQLRDLLPEDAELVVEKEQEGDYEVIRYDDTGLEWLYI